MIAGITQKPDCVPSIFASRIDRLEHPACNCSTLRYTRRLDEQFKLPRSFLARLDLFIAFCLFDVNLLAQIRWNYILRDGFFFHVQSENFIAQGGKFIKHLFWSLWHLLNAEVRATDVEMQVGCVADRRDIAGAVPGGAHAIQLAERGHLARGGDP